MPINTSPLAKQLRHSLHKNRLVYLAFAIPALILLASYMTRGIFPVGNRNVLTIDLYHQYAPFLAELQAKFTTGGSLFYSWAGGLGINFWALYSYYLASPLNVILVLFPPSYLTEAILLPDLDQNRSLRFILLYLSALVSGNSRICKWLQFRFSMPCQLIHWLIPGTSCGWTESLFCRC